MGLGHSIGTLLGFILQIYSWLILIRVLLSWVSPDPYNPIVQFLIRATDPVLRPIQRRLPSLGGLDLSPVVALFGIMMLQRLVGILFSGLDSGMAIAVLLSDLLGILHILLTLYMVLMAARAGMTIHSWLTFRKGQPPRINLHHPFNRFIFQVTEPTVRPLRGIAPTWNGMDLSPLIAALLLLLILSLIPDIPTLIASGMSPGGGGAPMDSAMPPMGPRSVMVP